MTEQLAGPILDKLGVTVDVDEGQQITEVMILCKIADFGNGETALGIGVSAGLDWIAQRGLLAAAENVLNNDQ